MPEPTGLHPSAVKEGDRLALAEPQTITAIRTDGKGNKRTWTLELENGDETGAITGDSVVLVYRD